MDDPPVRLEHRLTKIELSQLALQATGEAILKRLDTQNGAIQEHFKADEKWMDSHNIVHTQTTSFAAGRASVRKGDMALLLAAVTVATAVVNVAARFLA